jgi:hypothetical protein
MNTQYKITNVIIHPNFAQLSYIYTQVLHFKKFSIENNIWTSNKL